MAFMQQIELMPKQMLPLAFAIHQSFEDIFFRKIVRSSPFFRFQAIELTAWHLIIQHPQNPKAQPSDPHQVKM